jgi:hypothetical protein
MRQKPTLRARTGAAVASGAAAPEGGRGFTGTVGRVAVMVGSLTGIVGLVTSAEPLVKWVEKAWRRKAPHVTVAAGGVLNVRWNATARSLTLHYNADVLNEGDAPDRFLSAQAYLLDPQADPAHPDVHAALPAIEMTEKGQGVHFPLTVEAGQRLALALVVAPETVQRADLFSRTGVYRLVLELEKHGAPSRGCYCFFMGPETLAQLHAQGSLNVAPHLACQES